MKKFLVSLLIVCFSFCVLAKDAEKVSTVAITTIAPVVLVLADWTKANNEAKRFSSEGKYLEASEAYLAAGKVGVQIKDGFDQSRFAWALNNAAYMIILQHQKDNKIDLSKAKEYLEDALKIEGISLDCSEKAKSNLGYITGSFKLSNPVPTTTPEKGAPKK